MLHFFFQAAHDFPKGTKKQVILYNKTQHLPREMVVVAFHYILGIPPWRCEGQISPLEWITSEWEVSQGTFTVS